jgi:hypothetical protein
MKNETKQNKTEHNRSTKSIEGQRETVNLREIEIDMNFESKIDRVLE